MIKKTTDFSKLMTQFAMVGQLGLSLVTPLLICIFACYMLTTRLGVGGWVYIIGFFFGLGGSMMTAYKELGWDIENFPNAYDYYANLITLPLHTLLSDEDVEYVISNFKEVVKEYIN